MKLLLQGVGAILAIAFTLYCFGFVFVSVAEFLLIPVRVLAAILT